MGSAGGGGVRKVVKKTLKEMEFHFGGSIINWFPGHMAVASRAIRDRLKLVDFVIEVRDARMPLTSAYQDIQRVLCNKKRVIILNKKDLANPIITAKWVHYFESCKQDCLPLNSHHKGSVRKVLDLVEFKLKESITRQPTLLVMVVGVPNVGKSVLINAIHQTARSRFAAQDKLKQAKVGPLPGVTQDIAGFKIAHQPSIYVLDSPGVLAPSIPDVEAGLKLALAGSIKDSIVGEERIVRYLLALLNTRKTPLKWKHLNDRRIEGIQFESQEKNSSKGPQKKQKKPQDKPVVQCIKDVASEAQCALYSTFSEFDDNLEDADDLEFLIEDQFEALQRALKIPKTDPGARSIASKKFLTLFRAGLLGPLNLDDVPVAPCPVS